MTARGWSRSAAVLTALVGGLLLGTATPALAHAGGLSPSDDRTEVVSVTPARPALAVAMVNNGLELSLANSGTGPVTVSADPGGGPARVVPAGGALRYRDSRTARPAGVAADSVGWRIGLVDAAGAAVVQGRVYRLPRPWLLGWLLLTAAIAALGGMLGRRPRCARAVLAAGLLVVSAAGVAHTVGSALAVSGAALPGLLVGASGIGLACWPLAVLAAAALVRGKAGAAFVAAVVGAMLVLAGLPDVDGFGHPELPFAGPGWLARALVAVGLGGGMALVVAGTAAARRALPVAGGQPASPGTSRTTTPPSS